RSAVLNLPLSFLLTWQPCSVFFFVLAFQYYYPCSVVSSSRAGRIPADPPAPNNLFARLRIVKDRRLPRRDGTLRLVKDDAGPCIRQCRDRRRCWVMSVTHLDQGPNGFGRLVKGHPVHALGGKFAALQLPRLPDDYLVPCPLDLHNIERLLMRDPQAATLSHGVPVAPDRKR